MAALDDEARNQDTLSLPLPTSSLLTLSSVHSMRTCICLATWWLETKWKDEERRAVVVRFFCYGGNYGASIALL